MGVIREVEPSSLAPSPAIRLPRWILRWQRNVDDYGWRTAVKKGMAYLARPLYFQQEYRLYRIDLEKTDRKRNTSCNGFCFRVIQAHDAPAIEQIEGVAEWLRGRLRMKLSAGHLCLAAFDGGYVAAFNLVALQRVYMPLVQLRKVLRRGIAWSEHIAVRKEYRRAGLASQLRYALFDELRQRGIRILYAGALPSNVASTRMQEAVGLRPFVQVHYRRILFFQSWSYQRIHP